MFAFFENGIVNGQTERIRRPSELSFCWWSCRVLCRPEWVVVTTRRSPFMNTAEPSCSASLDGPHSSNGLKVCFWRMRCDGVLLIVVVFYFSESSASHVGWTSKED